MKDAGFVKGMKNADGKEELFSSTPEKKEIPTSRTRSSRLRKLPDRYLS